jgi:8-oxo-dGTP pyrophosphatase MutT (NUDIX family)
MSNKLMGAAAVILNDEGRILLVKHSYGKLNWELPGGLSEKNESAEETAKREVVEETALEVSVGRLTGIYYEPSNDMHHFVFLCQVTGNQFPQIGSSEILECEYYRIDDLPRPISDFTLQRIREAMNPDPNRLFHIIGPRQWLE